jgi:hypothetical protein
MERILVVILLASNASVLAQNLRLKVTFSPESGKFVEATREYQSLWDSEGARMVEAMESVSGLKFAEKEVRAIVYEGVSFSGFGDRPMKMRASYPPDIKKATLIHELGHRLLSRLPETREIDAHRALFLVLYDIWTKLYGKDFADKAVEVEKKRKGIYDYESAWNWALSLTQEERGSKFKELTRTS